MIKILLFLSAILVAYMIVYYATKDAVSVALNEFYTTHDFKPN